MLCISRIHIHIQTHIAIHDVEIDGILQADYCGFQRIHANSSFNGAKVVPESYSIRERRSMREEWQERKDEIGGIDETIVSGFPLGNNGYQKRDYSTAKLS